MKSKLWRLIYQKIQLWMCISPIALIYMEINLISLKGGIDQIYNNAIFLCLFSVAGIKWSNKSNLKERRLALAHSSRYITVGESRQEGLGPAGHTASKSGCREWWMHVAAQLQDLSRGTVPATEGRSSQLNQCNKDCPSRGCPEVHLDSRFLFKLTMNTDYYSHLLGNDGTDQRWAEAQEIECSIHPAVTWTVILYDCTGLLCIRAHIVELFVSEPGFPWGALAVLGSL